MRLSNLVLQPFSQLVTSYSELKESLKTEDRTSTKVQNAAAKVLLAGYYCAWATVLGGACITAGFLGHLSFCKVVLVLTAALGTDDEMIALSSLSVITGAGAVALLVHYAVSPFFPILGVVLGGIHCASGAMYFMLFSDKFKSAKDLVPPQFIGKIIHWAT